jgi:hypothetical protein
LAAVPGYGLRKVLPSCDRHSGQLARVSHVKYQLVAIFAIFLS